MAHFRSVVAAVAVLLASLAFSVPSAASAETGATAVTDRYSTPAATQLFVAMPGLLGNDLNADLLNVTVTATSPGGSLRNGPMRGGFIYKPHPDFVGVDRFSYCLSAMPDILPCVSNETTVEIDVQAPVAADDFYRVGVAKVLTVTPPGFIANDTGVSDSQITIVALPKHGTYGVGPLRGGFTYQPQPTYAGPDEVLYCLTAVPGVLPCLSNVAHIRLAVGAPSTVPDTYSATNAGDVTLGQNEGLLTNDVNTLASESFSVTRAPGHTTISAAKPGGGFTFRAAAGYVGDDSFAYCISALPNDGVCLSAGSSEVTLHITAVAPTPTPTPSPTTIPTTPIPTAGTTGTAGTAGTASTDRPHDAQQYRNGQLANTGSGAQLAICAIGGLSLLLAGGFIASRRRRSLER